MRLFDESEAGMKLASEIGSLANTPGYQQLVLRRFPNATFATVVREAYIQLGGRVSNPQSAEVSNNSQNINKKMRASTITSGRVSGSRSRSDLVGKLSTKDAIKAAIAESEH